MAGTAATRRLLATIALFHLACPGDLAAAAVSVIDARGRPVQVQAPAQRIVALAPHIVENLYSVGAGGKLVGTVEYADYPPAARAITRVGNVGGISLERVLALAPDLVIAWGSGTAPSVLGALDNLGVTYYVDEIRSLEELAASLRDLAALAGRDSDGERAAGRIEAERLAASGTATTAAPGVFLQIWDQPLQSIGGEHLLDEVITLCGGRNITAALPGLAPLVSIEAVVAADPALIVVESATQAMHWSRFPQLAAHRLGGVRVIDPDLLHRPTLRLLGGMERICAALRDLPAP